MEGDRSFAELQRQSDKNRMEFLRVELALGFTFAGIAQDKYRRGARDAGDISRADAEEGYSTVMRFLSDPKHAKHIREEERRELIAGLKRLRKVLDGLRK